MPGLDAARLRALADELDKEEAEAKRELEDAETKLEKEQAQAKIDELESKLSDLETKVKTPKVEEDEEETETEGETKPRTRKGRKHGAVYQNEKGGLGEVWQGEDEPDIVVIEEEADAA